MGLYLGPQLTSFLPPSSHPLPLACVPTCTHQSHTLQSCPSLPLCIPNLNSNRQIFRFNENSFPLCKAGGSSGLEERPPGVHGTPGSEENAAAEVLPSCPLPGTSGYVKLLEPCKSFPDWLHCSDRMSRPLLIYVPGMDCTAQGIRNQLPYLLAAGYDVRCIYIDSSDRSSWEKLTEKIIRLVKLVQTATGAARHVTLVGESFGGALALRLARKAPDVVSRLVLVNPATNFQKSSPLASFCARTGIIATLSRPLYKVAQDILLPLMVNRNRVIKASNEDMLSPVDYVPAACAAWRFSLLNDNYGLSDDDLRSIAMPTLLLSAAQDYVLSSVAEGGRLQKLLPNAKRVILPYSGHTVLLEDSINLASIMEENGFQQPKSALCCSNPLISFAQDSNFLKRKNTAVTDEVLDELGRLLEPWRVLTSPFVSGEENLPSPEIQLRQPLLFVGNHTMFGAYDTPLLLHELFIRGFRCRGLAHPGHWATVVGPIFEKYGHVKASKFAAYRLLKDGENILLFPGGAREVYKHKGEKYKLFWKPRTDFVRMASRFSAIIIPFAALGGDDAYQILWDANDLLRSPGGPLLQEIFKRLGISTDYIPPITSFPGTNIPSFLAVPSIERIYFHFAEPIDTSKFKSTLRDCDQWQALYLLVKERVQSSILHLKHIQENDLGRNLVQRLLQKALEVYPEFNRF